MDAIRARTYEEIELDKLLSEKEVRPTPFLGFVSLHSAAAGRTHAFQKRDLGLDRVGEIPSRPSSRLKRSESAPANKRPNSNPKSNPYLDRDNMVLPAIRQ